MGGLLNYEVLGQSKETLLLGYILGMTLRYTLYHQLNFTYGIESNLRRENTLGF